MKIFRNKELKNSIVIFTVAFAVVSVWCFKTRNTSALLPVAIMYSICRGTTVAYARRKYSNLENLALQLDRILHGDMSIRFEEFSEGELAILKNQLDKVVLKLHSQTEELQKEKIHLTDSIADISHQLRTPLTSINFIIGFLKDENLTEEKRWQLANDLQKLSGRIDWLVNALLKMSKIDAGTVVLRKDRILVRDLLKKAAGPLEIAMDLKDQRVIVNREGDEYFTGDMQWTAEAIGNLFKNCSEHTPQGGSITIDVRQTAVYTQITFTDTGNGFYPEDIPHLFERFYKGKNSSPGSVGIGLALARTIITSQNGTIKAENAPQGGARFIVKFYHTTV